VRRGAYLRSYAYQFIEQFAPALTRAEVDRAMNTEATPAA
jgi:LysR family cys regulon transcriptional activator